MRYGRTSFDLKIYEFEAEQNFETQCGLPLLQDRMKQSMASAHEAANFFKKRAQIEEEYARAMTKLARSSSQSYSMSEGKAG